MGLFWGCVVVEDWFCQLKFLLGMIDGVGVIFFVLLGNG